MNFDNDIFFNPNFLQLLDCLKECSVLAVLQPSMKASEFACVIQITFEEFSEAYHGFIQRLDINAIGNDVLKLFLCTFPEFIEN